MNINLLVASSDDRESRRSRKVLSELENIDDECDGRGVYFVKIDNYEEAMEYGIDTIPTLVYFESEIPYIFEGKSFQEGCFTKINNVIR